LPKIVAFEKQRHAMRFGAGVSKTIAEIEIRGMADDPPEPASRVQRSQADLRADRRLTDRIGFEKGQDDRTGRVDRVGGGRRSARFCTREAGGRFKDGERRYDQ
jgi:hypothetical protein